MVRPEEDRTVPWTERFSRAQRLEVPTDGAQLRHDHGRAGFQVALAVDALAGLHVGRPFSARSTAVTTMSVDTGPSKTLAASYPARTAASTSASV